MQFASNFEFRGKLTLFILELVELEKKMEGQVWFEKFSRVLYASAV